MSVTLARSVADGDDARAAGALSAAPTVLAASRAVRDEDQQVRFICAGPGLFKLETPERSHKASCCSIKSVAGRFSKMFRVYFPISKFKTRITYTKLLT